MLVILACNCKHCLLLFLKDRVITVCFQSDETDDIENSCVNIRGRHVGRHEIACIRRQTLHVAQISKNFKKQQNTQDQVKWPETPTEQYQAVQLLWQTEHHMMQRAFAYTFIASSQI